MQFRRPMHRIQSGMTLIELMIVVAIVGILASLAVFMYQRSTAQARASEVPAIFGEFRLRQEQFHLENGTYLSTAANEGGTWHPAAPATPASGGNAVDPIPATWTQLRMNSEKAVLYCSYVAIAGPGGDSTNIGTIANDFDFTAAPAVNWFYLIADCDLDGKSAVDSQYFARSGVDGHQVHNEGR